MAERKTEQLEVKRGSANRLKANSHVTTSSDNSTA